MEKEYNTLLKNIYRYAYIRLNNKEDAEDVASETLLRVYKQDQDSKKENVITWTYGVARNVIQEKYREKTKHSSVDLENIKYQAEDYDVNRSELEGKIDDKKLLEEAIEILKQLPDQSKEVIMLKLWDEMKFTEIASLVGDNESAVKQRYYRGLEQLKNSLSKDKKSTVTPILLLSTIVNLRSVKALQVSSALLKTGVVSSLSGAATTTATGFTLGMKIAVISVLIAVSVPSTFIINNLIQDDPQSQESITVSTSEGEEEEIEVEPTLTLKQIDTSKWKTYKNVAYGFSLKYPKGGTLIAKPIESFDVSTFPATCVKDSFHTNVSVPDEGGLAFYYYSSEWAELNDFKFNANKLIETPFTLFGQKAVKADLLCHGDGFYKCDYVRDGSGIRFTFYYVNRKNSKMTGNLVDPNGKNVVIYTFGKSTPTMDKIIQSIKY